MKFVPRNFSVLYNWKKPAVNPLVLDKVVLQAKEFLNSNILVKSNDPFSISSSAPASSMLLTLFNNQADVIQAWMVKLKGSKHPIVNLARELCREDVALDKHLNENGHELDFHPASSLFSLSNHLRAIIVLLVSKSISFPTFPVKVPQSDSQRTLAEVTELMHAAYVLHKTVVDVPKFEDVVNASSSSKEQNSSITNVGNVEKDVPSNDSLPKELSLLHQGNNLAALMGDLLLAKSSRGLSSIRNSRVTELMTDTIADFAESEFVIFGTILDSEKLAEQKKSWTGAATTKTATVDDSLHGVNRHVWLRKNQLGMGSLLGHACYCSLLLSGHDESVRQLGYRLGEKVGLLLEASKEISFFLHEEELLEQTVTAGDGAIVVGRKNIPLQFDLCSLPVINALELQTISLERLRLLKTNFFSGHVQIYNEIQAHQNEESVERLKEALCNLQEDCMKIVRQLQPQSKLDGQSSPPMEATRILTDIIHSLSPL